MQDEAAVEAVNLLEPGSKTVVVDASTAFRTADGAGFFVCHMLLWADSLPRLCFAKRGNDSKYCRSVQSAPRPARKRSAPHGRGAPCVITMSCRCCGASSHRVGLWVPGTRTRPRRQGGGIETHRKPRVRAPRRRGRCWTAQAGAGALLLCIGVPLPDEPESRNARCAPPGSLLTFRRCYPTGFIGLTRPLVDAKLLPAGAGLVCHAISGYSGGGKALIKASTTLRPLVL